MERATALDLMETIWTKKSVMILEDDVAIELDRVTRTRDAILFGGVTRDGSSTEFDVPTSMINDDMFLVTTKAEARWPW